jgi:phosphoribosyl-ATP pyrophosphohydrolase
MLIPSIDLEQGRVVQLRNGRDLVLELGAAAPWAERFAPLGEIAVIDLDAARGRGSNRACIEPLCDVARCRVGGGIRDRDTALRWLDRGAAKVVLGTAAEPDLLRKLPRDRVIAAVDSWRDDVVVHGWAQTTGESTEAKLRRLAPYVGGFLVTFVETEGTLGGFDVERAARLVDAAGGVRITFAGGIVDAATIAALDRIGADAQVGMALYTGALEPAAALWATLARDRPDGLVPTTVCDRSGRLLMLAYSNAASLAVAIAERAGVYWSRTRGLWRKGSTSGARQHLVRIDVDCDRDALRFTVEQTGGACHTGSATCFGDVGGTALLERTIRGALGDGSYTKRLLATPELLAAKLVEEAAELADAADRDAVVAEAADVLYFTLVRLAASGASLADVEAELDRRALRVVRRGGDAKPRRTAEVLP